MMKRETELSCGGRLEMAGLPPHPKGVVIICPGGGYEWLSPREAEPVAQAFARVGWVGLILRYTCFEGEPLGKLPLRQLGEALRLAREAFPGLPAAVCGFSAGGHVAASLGVHWQEEGLPAPDALILGYPVITAGEYAHRGSIRALAGDGDPSYYSLEKHVGAHTPRTFLWQTASDEAVPVQNSLLFAGALAAAKVPFEYHVYPAGVHGLSLATPEVAEPEKGRLPDAHVAGWFDQCAQWLKQFIEE